MPNAYSVSLFQYLSQILGDGLLLLEEGLSRLYPREPRKRLCEENYRFNKERDVINTIINDQSTGEVTGINELRIGKADVGTSGCEIIAVYNALYLMGKECSFAKVERDFELNGALTKVPFVPIGAYGSNPYALKRMLEINGLRGKRVSKTDMLNNPGTYIYSYWNKGGLLKGLHTIIAENDSKVISLYNYASKGVFTISRDEWMDRFGKRYIIGLSISKWED